VSPVDRNVGQAIKLKIAALYEEEYARNRVRWELPKREGGLGDSVKRMLVAKWTSQAWTEICATHYQLIRSAFVKTGFLLAKDGSENHLIELWKVRKDEYRSVGPGGETYNF
jgi:hypothetical protein